MPLGCWIECPLRFAGPLQHAGTKTNKYKVKVGTLLAHRISRSREIQHERSKVPKHTSSRLTCGKLSERSAYGAK